MVSLKQLFPNLNVADDIIISNIQNDSRSVDSDSLFIAYTGFERDVHLYIESAYAKGCRYFLIDQSRTDEFHDVYKNALFISCNNLKQEMSRVVLEFFNYPDRELILIGVTGTNGKTTTASLINQGLRSMGKQTSFFGTVEWCVGTECVEAVNTTPDFLQLVKFLRETADQNIPYVVMEVASHALSLGRVEGLNFDCAVFTNLTQDHLDFHDSLEEYYKAKEKLFVELLAESNKKNKKAFVNADDPYGQRLLKILGERGIPSTSLSINDIGFWNAHHIELSVYQTKYQLESATHSIAITSKLLGLINVQNTMAAYVVLDHLGFDSKDIVSALSHISVKGRLQVVEAPNGIIFLVDYAHTPDALEKAVDVVNKILEKGKKSIVVFGAGGDRDRTKRPLMAKATECANIVIVTSDNPRTEDPEDIIDDIMAGFECTTNVFKEIDRQCAIQSAYQKAEQGDVILIAGKGHEDYQIVGKTKKHFSDVEEIQKCINLL